MAELSPAAQAVRDHFLADAVISFEHGLAAALRAAASCMEFVQDIAKLHQIATELEGTRQGEQP